MFPSVILEGCVSFFSMGIRALGRKRCVWNANWWVDEFVVWHTGGVDDWRKNLQEVDLEVSVLHTGGGMDRSIKAWQ